jgi:hypothetical protein
LFVDVRRAPSSAYRTAAPHEPRLFFLSSECGKKKKKSGTVDTGSCYLLVAASGKRQAAVLFSGGKKKELYCKINEKIAGPGGLAYLNID